MARGPFSFIALALALLACDNANRSKEPNGPATVATIPGAPGASTAKPPRESDPTPDPTTHPCVVHNARFKVALRERDDSCQADADCACYPGGMDASGCGGVTSKKTAAVLATIAAEFRTDGCTHSLRCAAWACQPTCVSGRCQR